MRNYFTFGSVDSRSFGVYISGSGVFNAPERAMNFINVPGRNGALIGNEDRFENIDVTYPAFIAPVGGIDFKDKITKLRSALLSITSYARLEDSYNSSEFRQAVFVGGLDVDPTQILDAGKFNLTFNCKPQRWLTSGEQEGIHYVSGGEEYNPSKFDSLPRIKVYGYGTFYIGSQAITVANAYPTVTIDSELGDCYSGTENANSVVSFGNDHFPVLSYGSNVITFPNTITEIDVLPRWWRI